MFINIRGAFGSGKTTVMTGLIDLLRQANSQESVLEYHSTFVPKPVKMAQVFSGVTGLMKPVAFIGTYGRIACCGADQLNYKGAHENMRAFIREIIKTHHVLIEGSIVSNSGGYLKMAKELTEQGHWCLFYHLNTPLDTCIERVKGRRDKSYTERKAKAEAKGKTLEQKEFDPKNLILLYNNILKTKEKTLEAGLTVLEFDSSAESSLQLFNMLKKDERTSL